MAKKFDSYVNIRIALQKVFIAVYKYNKDKSYSIDNYISIGYKYNLYGQDNKDFATIIEKVFEQFNINPRGIAFTISSSDISIMRLSCLKKNKYSENVKLLDALAKQENSLLEENKSVLAYKVLREFKTKVVSSDKKKKEKELDNIEVIAYITPVEIINNLKSLSALLGKELLYINYSGNSFIDYYQNYYVNGLTNSLLLHISDEYTLISVYKNGKLVDQIIDNFSYSSIQKTLKTYKQSLNSNLNTIEDTINTINNMNLYTITEEDLGRYPNLLDTDKEQILAAKETLTSYTIDFIDRIGIILDNNNKSDNKINQIVIYNDQRTFPDLTYTVKLNFNLDVININFTENLVKGVENIYDPNYILSTIIDFKNILNLDNSITVKLKNDKLQTRIFFSILPITTLSVIIIVLSYMLAYFKETEINMELNSKIIEAEEAESLYTQHQSLQQTYDTFANFKNTTNDLSNFDVQMKKIARIIPEGMQILSISATSGEGTSAGSLNLSFNATNKDIVAKFLLELENLQIYQSIEQNGVSESGSENNRIVSGNIVCNYYPPEESSVEDESILEEVGDEISETIDENTVEHGFDDSVDDGLDAIQY